MNDDFFGFYRWTLTQNLYKRGDSSEWSGIFVKLEEPKMFKAVASECPPYMLHALIHARHCKPICRRVLVLGIPAEKILRVFAAQIASLRSQ